MDLFGYNLTFPNITVYVDNISRSSNRYYKTRQRAFSNNMTMLTMVSITIYSIILILGIIENGLVIWIAGFRMKKTINSVWLLNLAIADFLFCVSIPVYITWEADLIERRTSFIYILLLQAFFTLNISTSVLLLTAMSLDRWVSVMWPFWAKVHRTNRKVGITAVVIWVISLVLTGFMFYVYIKQPNSHTMRIIDSVRLVIMFVIPFLIIFTTYVTIYIKLRNSKRPPRSQRPYRIITVVVLCFFICWFPFYIWPLIPVYYRQNIPIVFTIVMTLSFLNSCINPIIYVFMDQDFQQGFLRSIPFRQEKALTEDPVDHFREQVDHEPAPNTANSYI